jgi:hypothetical protein
VIGDKPLPSFDATRLSPLEKCVLAAVLTRCGRRGVEELFDNIVCWVVELVAEGNTAAKVRETVVGSFCDDALLMRLDQSIRNQTLILAKALVSQAIEALCR